MKKSMVLILVVTLCAIPLIATGQSEADEFPSKSLKLIVPFSAGGGTDLVSRALAIPLGEILGQPVVVENKTGGVGMVGAAEVINSKPDGYTLIMGTVGLVSLPALGTAPPNIGYDRLRPIFMLNSDPGAITVRADSPYKTINDLIEAAKDNPESISVGNGGANGTFHLTAISVGLEGDVKFLHVPHSGGTNEAVLALLGGHVDAVASSPAEVAAHVENGDLRILGVANVTRLESYPDVKTFKEQGINVALGTWRGIMVPADTPDAIAEILEDAVAKASVADSFFTFMKNGGYGIDNRDSGAFSEMLSEQAVLFENVAKIVTIK